MKKEILVVISVTLVVVIVGCGLWLGWYALDSHHQKQAFAGLSQEFVLEEPTAADEQPAESNTAEGEASTVTLAVSDPQHPVPPRPGRPASRKFGLRGLAHHPRHGHRLPHHAHTGGTGTLPPQRFPWAIRQRRHAVPGRAQHSPGGEPESHRVRPQYAGRQYVQVPRQTTWTQTFGKATRTFIWSSVTPSTVTRCWRCWRPRWIPPVYRYTDLSDPAVESDFRSALFQAADLDVIHHTEGYLTLSTCGDWGGDTRVLVVASLAEEVGE